MRRSVETIGLVLGVMLSWASTLPALAATAESDLLAAGREIYLAGRRADGTSLAATVQSDVSLPPGASACVNCHRRSGLGTAEGSVRTLPVTGSALFSSTALRPAYDAASLRRALTDGIGATGKPLNAAMPLYPLADRDADALVAYLRHLGSDPPVGVSADEIELATIVGESTPPGLRDAMLTVLERYVAIKNSQTRREGDRAAAAMRHPLGERRDRAFRRWRLSVWTLRGPANTWDSQLRRYYENRAPFALLSGVAVHDWRVVHEFCERMRVPCVLPITDVPGDVTTGFYSLYFSLGSALEGRITARHIAPAISHQARVLLLYSDDERALAARDGLHGGLRAERASVIAEREVPRAQPMRREDWRKLLAEAKPDILVAFLDAAQLRTLGEISGHAASLPDRIYTAESVSSWRELAATTGVRGRVWHVYPWQPPTADHVQFPREQAWLRAQHLESLDAAVASRALFACHALGEGLASIEANFSREYLLEQFEHMLDRTGMTSLFPVTRQGPGQRVLSNGAYVLRIGDPPQSKLIAGPWLTY